MGKIFEADREFHRPPHRKMGFNPGVRLHEILSNQEPAFEHAARRAALNGCRKAAQ